MKKFIPVTVEVELSASDIRRFHQNIDARSHTPMADAINNVKELLKDEVKNPHLLQYWAR